MNGRDLKINGLAEHIVNTCNEMGREPNHKKIVYIRDIARKILILLRQGEIDAIAAGRIVGSPKGENQREVFIEDALDARGEIPEPFDEMTGPMVEVKKAEPAYHLWGPDSNGDYEYRSADGAYRWSPGLKKWVFQDNAAFGYAGKAQIEENKPTCNPPIPFDCD